jgi:NAD-dependent dihydropyrimidine dehydrogenase PreA subunit
VAKIARQVIKIDEDLCNGCGLCVPACAEGAIQIIDGKAKLVSDRYCDGLGACLGDCPTGAITFETREAEEFDESAVAVHMKEIGREFKPQAHQHLNPGQPEAGGGHSHAQQAHAHHGHGGGGCPSARTFDFRRDEEPEDAREAPKLRSELRQWPVKLNLVNPSAPYFQDADLLVAADCAPFAFASLHPEFLKGKAVVIGCPKFDDLAFYQEKLQTICALNEIRSITVLIMEVPCCGGLLHIAREAVKASGKDIPIKTAVVTLRGEIEEPRGLLAM